MSSAPVERRVAPRFAVRCRGELAAGNAVVAVTVSDISVTGCGIEVVDGSGERLGRTGVLRLRGAQGGAPPVLLPVAVSNHREQGDRLRLGLQFRRLTMGQMRSLIGVMDGAIER